MDNNEGSLTLENEAYFFDFGLVNTTYSSQGMTSKKTILLADSTTSSSSWYVGISRAKEETKVITDNIEKLKKSVLRDNHKENALEYLSENEIVSRDNLSPTNKLPDNEASMEIQR